MTKMQCPQNVATAIDVDGDERQKVRGKTVGREGEGARGQTGVSPLDLRRRTLRGAIEPDVELLHVVVHEVDFIVGHQPVCVIPTSTTN